MSAESVPTPRYSLRAACAAAWDRTPCGAPLDVQLQSGVTLVTGGEGAARAACCALLAGDLAVAGSSLQLAGTGLESQPAQYRQKAFWMDPRTSAWDQTPAAQFFQQSRRQWPQWNAELCQSLFRR